MKFRQYAEYALQAEMYEFAIELHKAMWPIFESTKSYGMLSKSYDECAHLYSKIMESVTIQQLIFLTSTTGGN
jgi:hypothetical protein